MIETQDAETRIKFFVQCARSLPRLYEQAQECSILLNNYGVSSPRIMSLEEAKYQKGTRIYSNINLLEAIEAETEAWVKYHEASLYCGRMGRQFAKLDDFELDLLYYKYECSMTLDQIGVLIGYSKSHTKRLIDNVLRKL